jgi:hypothetical protein
MSYKSPSPGDDAGERYELALEFALSYSDSRIARIRYKVLYAHRSYRS